MGDIPDDIDSYVAGLARALHGPRRFKTDLVTEARDSLRDAAAAYQESGLSPAQARHRAVAEFGALELIVPGYQAELGLAQARRTALVVFTVLAAQTVAWGPARRSLFGAETPPGIAAMLDGSLNLLGGLAMLAAIGFLAGMRYARPGLTRVAGTAVLTLSFVMAGIGLTTTLLSGTHLLAWSGLPWTVAFGVLPMLLTATSARACLRAALVPLIEGMNRAPGNGELEDRVGKILLFRAFRKRDLQ